MYDFPARVGVQIAVDNGTTANAGEILSTKKRGVKAVKEARKAAEAQRIAEAEQRAREQEAARIAAQQAEDARVAALAAQRERDAAAESVRVAAAAAAPVVQACRPEDRAIVATPAGAEMVRKVIAAIDEPATLKLADIGERLGFALRADFITGTLHVAPSAVERGLPRFTESQFGLICRQLVAHVSAMAEVHAVEEVA